MRLLSIIKKFQKNQNFWTNENGQISLMFALLFVPIALVAGGALDFANNYNTQQKTQYAVDAALLAAVKTEIDLVKYSTEAQRRGLRKQAFRNMFEANFGSENAPKVEFVFTKTGMSVNVRGKIETTVLKLGNINNLEYTVAAGSAFPIQSTFEIVLIFDATGSMAGIIDTVKTNATNFTTDILANLQAKNIQLDRIYTKVIAYKDYWVDADPMYQTRFFNLPTENFQFKGLISPITASGGFDAPESALEAIKFAMNAKSPARRQGITANKLIVLWTDAEAIPLKRNRKKVVDKGLMETAKKEWVGYYPNYMEWYNSQTDKYPRGMPKTLSRLQYQWNRDKNTEILLFYGNNGAGKNYYPWKQMKAWERTTHIVGNPNNISYTVLIDKIATSLSNMTTLRLTK